MYLQIREIEKNSCDDYVMRNISIFVAASEIWSKNTVITAEAIIVRANAI